MLHLSCVKCLTLVVVPCCCGSTIGGQNTNIENHICTTVVYPDTRMPTINDGGFETQDEFQNFVSKMQNGKTDVALHRRPTQKNILDYEDDVLARAFPLQFPFGYSGFPCDPIVKKLSKTKGRI